jgi:hypothetical protein
MATDVAFLHPRRLAIEARKQRVGADLAASEQTDSGDLAEVIRLL